VNTLGLAAAVLVFGAMLALLFRTNSRRGWAALLTQALATGLVLTEAVPTLMSGRSQRAQLSWSYPIESFAVHLDPLGAFFLAWSLPMTLLGTIYATGVQFALLNVTALSFIAVYVVENAFVFLLGWEIAALAAWLLVIWDYRNQKIRFAGFNYLVSTHVGLIFLVAAFMVMYSQTGSLDFQAFARFLRLPGTMRDATFVLLVTSFGLKSAFFPFHTWLPRAHAAAPAHVSALMSGVIHKAGLFGLLRFILLIGRPEEWMGWFLGAFSLLSAVSGVLYTTSQRDLKRLLGYSSTENVGIAGLAFAVGCLGLSWGQPTLVALGFVAGLLHVLNHALFKCLLFYAAGAVYRVAHSVDLERLGGLLRRMPWTGWLFLLGALATCAVPPLNGFVSEFLIFCGLLEGSAPAGLSRLAFAGAASLLAFVGGVSALAMTRAFGGVFLGVPRDATVHAHHDVGWAMRAPMLLHGLGIVVLGFFPRVGVGFVRQPALLFLEQLPGVAPWPSLEHALRRVEPVGLVALLLLAFGLGLALLRLRLLRGAAPPRHVTWGCGYTAPTARMQYTGASFSDFFTQLFSVLLVFARREKLPKGPFPQGHGHLHTHGVDAVEQRLFLALGEGERQVTRMRALVPEAPGPSFGAGLLVLVVMVGLVLAAAGVLK
jgi:hydrogenase-4 component B